MYSEEEGIYSFYPEKGTEVNLLRFTCVLDPDFLHIINEDGIFLKGKTAEELRGGNTHGSFIIPAESEFAYHEERGAGYYIFLLGDSFCNVILPDTNVVCYTYLAYKENLDFRTQVSEKTQFYHDSKLIEFYKNDIIVCSNETGIGYDLFSAEYRLETKLRSIQGRDVITKKDLELMLESEGEDLKFTEFSGSEYFIYISENSYNPVLEDVTPKEQEDAINYTRSSFRFMTSYIKKIIVPLKIKQFNRTKEGNIAFFIPDEEIDHLENIVSENEGFYLLFKLGAHNELTAESIASVIYVFDKEQYKNL